MLHWVELSEVHCTCTCTCRPTCIMMNRQADRLRLLTSMSWRSDHIVLETVDSLCREVDPVATLGGGGRAKSWIIGVARGAVGAGAPPEREIIFGGLIQGGNLYVYPRGREYNPLPEGENSHLRGGFREHLHNEYDDVSIWDNNRVHPPLLPAAIKANNPGCAYEAGRGQSARVPAFCTMTCSRLDQCNLISPSPTRRHRVPRQLVAIICRSSHIPLCLPVTPAAPLELCDPTQVELLLPSDGQ